MPYRNVHHYPSCRLVAGGAVAARYQTAVDPWPIQNGRQGLAPVCRLPADCTADGSRNRIKCAGSKQAGIVLILKSVDKGKNWKRDTLCGDRVATILPIIAETMER